MKIILLSDVDSLGMAGEVITVAPGYARNYLLPASLALLATEGNLKKLAKKRAEFELRAKEVREQALTLKDQIDALRLIIEKKAGEKGKLYGAVTAQDIVEAAALKNVIIDRKRMRLSEPIKALGDFEVPVRLQPEVTAIIKVVVVPEETEETKVKIAETEKVEAKVAETEKVEEPATDNI